MKQKLSSVIRYFVRYRTIGTLQGLSHTRDILSLLTNGGPCGVFQTRKLNGDREVPGFPVACELSYLQCCNLLQNSASLSAFRALFCFCATRVDDGGIQYSSWTAINYRHQEPAIVTALSMLKKFKSLANKRKVFRRGYNRPLEVIAAELKESSPFKQTNDYPGNSNYMAKPRTGKKQSCSITFGNVSKPGT